MAGKESVRPSEGGLQQSLLGDVDPFGIVETLQQEIGPGLGRRSGLVSFVIDGVSAQDLAILLDQQGVAIRAGHHCAMPLHDYLGLRNSCRASFYLYNTMEEVD